MRREFPARIWREGKWWLAHSAELNIASNGRTEKEAAAMLKDAIEQFFQPDPPIPAKPNAVIVVDVPDDCINPATGFKVYGVPPSKSDPDLIVSETRQVNPGRRKTRRRG
ncbi:MAG: type II toxin-antitoxin system HicB family antitoxin [Elusimicrobiota bacterium]|jgi:predicted RNase H-like HicB family nuclease